MQSTQTRSQKNKTTPTMTDRGASIAVESKQGKAEDPAIAAPDISAEERERFVAQAAYFRAEKRGFAPGCELQDWVEAEAEVLRLIGGG